MDINKLTNEEILFLYITHKMILDEYDKIINEKYGKSPYGPFIMLIPLEEKDIDELKNSIPYRMNKSIVERLYYMADIIASEDEYKYILEHFKIDEISKPTSI